MSATLPPDGSEPEGQAEPERSGTDRPTNDDGPESVGKSLGRKVLEGAAQTLGATLISVLLLNAGGVIAETLDGPHQKNGGAASSNSCTA
ncbi:hypothetical protein ACIRFF_36415 [Streptomyces cyaneofuscatus]